MAIRIGAQIYPQQVEYSELRAAWVKAEELGADTLFSWDHFFPIYGDADAKHFECWTFLAAIAEVTERVHFGPLVTCNSYDLEASLPVIRERFAKLNPPPVRGTVPVMIGGKGEKVMLRIVAEHADIWNAFGDPETFRHKNAVLDEWCRKADRDPATIERSVLLRTRELDDPDAYVAAGVTHLICPVAGPDFDFGPIRELVAWRDARS